MVLVEDLNVYKLGFQVSIKIYKITENFPKNEVFGLVSQMRRAAISINSNLVEGNSRNSTKEYIHFIGISKGSASELLFQVKIAKELGFINETDSLDVINSLIEITKMLTGLRRRLESMTN